MPAASLSRRAHAPLIFPAILVSCGLLLSLSACQSAPAAEEADNLSVVTSFYPLQFIAERIGGDAVTVTNLTKPGAEPHDLELSPQQVAALADSDLAVRLSGFQPAVDDAFDVAGPPATFDARPYADLSLTYSPIEESSTTGTSEPSPDPHFWLDPMRLANVADALAAKLASLDPEHAEEFSNNARTLRGDLTGLDTELRRGLADCANEDLVTSHTAFGYFADAYGLQQVGIAGLTPESEPDPGALTAVTDFVEANDVHTIYFETLVSPDIAETIAGATGATTAVLDPLEGLSDASDGDNYLEIMRSNLAQLQRGQPCT
ncbi:MAG TPA: metal ABC transporter substrate-binding protein [Actinomycetes bacterium]|nr:metal ABC transporter substrate-binding protein [Actinomycetes bacterium]